MHKFFHFFRQSLSSILFVRVCPLCGERLEETSYDDRHPQTICTDCLRHLPRTEQVSLRGNSTEDKFYRTPSFRRGAAFLFMDADSPIRVLVHSFKYHSQPELAYSLAHEAALDYMQSDFFDGIDYILPIPLHPRRQRQRGYNQSEYIAKALSDASGIPVDTTHLTRVVNNPHQALQVGANRRKNVEAIFAVNHPEEFYRCHVLLVDDVLTTGSTLQSAMDALEVCKGIQISVFVLAKAR